MARSKQRRSTAPPNRGMGELFAQAAEQQAAEQQAAEQQAAEQQTTEKAPARAERGQQDLPAQREKPREEPREEPRSRVLTVSQINGAARSLIEKEFGLVSVEGEISNFSRPSSGHWYFSLKDANAQIRCAMFARRNILVRDTPRDGLSVVVRGRLSLYEARGEFQLIAEDIAPAGEGALRVALEKLRKKLTDEGLFDAERKRELPAYPRHVAVVSSRSGAALRDVRAVLGRRFPCLRVTLLPVAVQGDESEPQVLRALDQIEAMKKDKPDVVILTRGGGSLEDLWTFNLESVVRKVAALSVPIVSAIGHETDVTLCDHAADQRAATPSAAAELVTPDRDDLLLRMARLQSILRHRARQHHETARLKLNAVARRLADPRRTLEQRQQRTDELGVRLSAAMHLALSGRHNALVHQSQLLSRSNPGRLISDAAASVGRLLHRLVGGMGHAANHAQTSLNAVARALHAVSPLNTLERGYAIASKPDGSRWGKPVTRPDEVSPEDRLDVHLSGGTVHTKVVPE